MAGNYGRHNAELEFHEDPAFEPHASFDFEEVVDPLGNGMAAYNAFPGDGMEYDFANGVHNDSSDFGADFFHGEVAPPFEFQSSHNVAASATAQSHPAFDHVNQVKQHFGQTMPLEDTASLPFKVPQSVQALAEPQQCPRRDATKLSNEQRARVAANTRHARTKNANKKRASEEGGPDSDDEDGHRQSKNINVQREKNRLAAAKCRAKKKSANEQQEEMANDFSATNNYLTREIRELKNQKSEFQNLLLAHRPGMCECHGIHDYNFGQAQRLVLNARAQVVGASDSSSSRGSVFSARSPTSQSPSGILSGLSPSTSQEGAAVGPGVQLLDDPMVYALKQMAHPRTMRADQGEMEDQQMHREFAEFLRSSPGGPAAFS